MVPKADSMTMVLLLDWPANSPDLNPIENIYSIVKRKMRDTRPNNADDLKAAIKATWDSFRQGKFIYIAHFIHSGGFLHAMPH